MNRLEQLPEIAERNLGGLTADQRLYIRIRLAAAEKQNRVHGARLRPSLTMCLSVALCVSVGLWAAWPMLFTGSRRDTLLNSGTAGNSSDTRIRVQALDVPAGSVSVGGVSDSADSFRNLYAAERGGNFPLVMVGDAVYRMLISPTNMDPSLLGASLGEVTEYTLEPALSTGGIVSNTVSAGETVYAVSGMDGAVAAAYVNGSLRVFQRVGFAGAAVLGGETLENTLVSASHVTALEMTGAGIVADPATAQSLVQTLLADASYENASSGTDDVRSLQLALDNGLILQMMVGDDTVSACGTWSCPEFFEAYAAAVAK
jgi:hypothetical protein